MDQFAFVKVSLEDAKAALDDTAVQVNLRPAPEKDWRLTRHPGGHHLAELGEKTFKWLATLPKEVRPRILGVAYPRIANRLAEIWARPLQCERFLDELMMDMRGNRKGFPRDVAAEIAALKVYFISINRTIHFDVWGGRIGID